MPAFQDQHHSRAQVIELGFDREGFPNQRYGEVRAQISGEIIASPELAGRVAHFAAQTAIQELKSSTEPLTLTLQHYEQFLSGVCSRGTGADLSLRDDGRKLAKGAVDLIAAFLIEENICHNFNLRVTVPATDEPFSALDISSSQIVQPVLLSGAGGFVVGVEFSNFDLSALLPEQSGKFGPFSALYCRTQFGDIVGIFPEQGPRPDLYRVAVDAYESRRRGSLVSYQLLEQDFAEGQVRVGAPLVVRQVLQTSPVREIVAAKSEPRFGQEVEVVHVSRIRIEFEQMTGLE